MLCVRYVTWCLIFFLSATAGGSIAATVLDDFEREDAGFLSPGNTTLSLTTAVGGSTPGKALAIEWPKPHGAWVECAYRTPKPVPGLTAESTVTIRIDVWVPASPGITSFAVRLVDPFNEVFQWKTKLDASPQAGWRTLAIPIDLERPAGHWGGRNGGRMGFPLKLLGYAAVFANADVPAGRLLVDQVRAEPTPAVSLETDRFPSLVNATGPAKCNMVINNPTAESLNISVEANITTLSGQPVPFKASVEVAANGSAPVAVPLPDRSPGIRWLDATLTYNGQSVSRKMSFVVADPVERATGKDRFLFGICSHTENAPADEREPEMQAAAAAGASVVRVGVSWASLEPAPGKWRWEVQDQLVELAARYGMETQPILGYGPAHAVSETVRAAQAAAIREKIRDPWKITLFGPPEEAPWRRYVSTMADRYRGRIRLYEVWNEPDLGFWRGTTEQYLQILRAAHEEVHRVDSDALILTGGFATVLEHQGRAQNHDLQERVLAEASDAFDVHAFHQHGTFEEFKFAVEGELRRIRSRMAQPRPLYFNETAISSAYIGEKAQAITLVKKMAYAMAQGAIGYTWYDLRNDGTNPSDMEHNYGLLTDRFRPKAAFAAYSEVVRQLDGTRHLGDLDVGSQRQAHVFGGARGRVVVWWNQGRNAPEIPLLLRCGNGVVRSVDIMGVARELPQVDGVVLVQPSAMPQYLQLPGGAGLPAIAGTLVDLDMPPEAAIGLPVQGTVRLTNPLERDISIRLSWRDAAGKNAESTITVPANGKSEFPLTAEAPAAGTQLYQMRLGFAVAGTLWAGTVNYAAPVVRLLGNQPPADDAPTWVLDKRSDVVSFCEADPALAPYLWRGPADLGARVWVWREDNALRLRVDVQDDNHVQEEKPQEMWKGDSVQVGLKLPHKKGYWEIGAALDKAENTVKAVWAVPEGFAEKDAAFDVNCKPIPSGLRYELTLPCDPFGLTDEVLQQGLGFNLVVNDNDGALREGLLRLAPGLGESKDPRLFPTIRFSARK